MTDEQLIAQQARRIAELEEELALRKEAEKNAEHADEQFDADFALMTGELSRFLPSLANALGGELIDLAEQGLAADNNQGA